MSVSLESLDTGNVTFPEINVDSDDEDETEVSICIICAKSISSDPDPKTNNRESLLDICCKLLRIELTDELIVLWNNSKRLSICEICESLLKSFMMLYDQYMNIRTSLRKMENNAKMQIINSQTIFQLSGGVCEKNDELLFTRLTDQALKDFNPILQLPKIDSGGSDNPEKWKSKGRKRKCQRNGRQIRAAGSLPKDLVIKEEIIEFSENINDGDLHNDFDLSPHFGIDGGEVDSKTERLDLPFDYDEDSHQFGAEDIYSDSDHKSLERKPDDNELKSKSSSEKRKPRKRSKRTKITCPIAAREARNAKRRKKHLIIERLPQVGSGSYSFRTIKYSFDETAKLYQCGSCRARRKNHTEMRCHISDLHPVEGYGKWSYNGVKYSLDKESGRVKCELCSKTFISRCAISKHIRGWHNDQGEILTIKGKIKTKNRKNPPVQLEEGKWLFKGVEFSQDKSTGYYHCGRCGRVRKRKGSIVLHIMESHDVDGKKENQCEQCHQAFDTKYRLKVHMDIHIPKSHQCEQCGQIFQQRTNLFRHIARIHKQVRPFICEVCGKSFFSRKDCRVHLRTHTKEKPYLCQVPNCGMSFSLLASKRKHECRVHPNSSTDNVGAVSNNLEFSQLTESLNQTISSNFQINSH